MDTLKLTTLFNILGFYLQGCTMLLGIYTFNRQSMVFKEYILTSVLMTILTYTVNLLPISMGVKIIINMLMLYLMCITLLKMPPYKTIRSTSLSFDLLLLCEMIVTAVMVKISGQEQFEILLNHPIQRNFLDCYQTHYYLYLLF